MTDFRVQATDAEIEEALQAVKSALLRRMGKHGRGYFIGKMEGLGVVTEEYQELIQACRGATPQYIRDEAMDVVVGALWVYASLSPRSFVRDPDDECVEYSAGEPAGNSHCETDGHYLCRGCIHNLHRVEHESSTPPCAFPDNVRKETL